MTIRYSDSKSIMVGNWPLLDRRDVTDRLIHILRQPHRRALFLVGSYGSGKTELLRALKDEWPGRCHLVHGSTAAGFMASHSLSTVDVLLIDDLDRLDDHSFGLLIEAVTAKDLRLVATIRPLSYPGLTAKAQGINAEVVEVPPLTPAELLAYCTGKLGGPIDDLTLDEILHVCGGLPIFVRDAIETLVERGLLRSFQGVWRLDGGVQFSPWFSSAVASSLASLTGPERDLLELLGITDSLALIVVDAMNAGETLESLEQRHLVQWSDDGESAMLSSAGQWLFPAVLASRSRARRRRVALACLRTIREPVDRSGAIDPLSLAKIRLAAGAVIDRDEAIAAARVAQPSPRCIQLLLGPYAQDQEAATLLADALIRQGQPRSAEQALQMAAASTVPASRPDLVLRRLDVLTLWLSDIRTATRTLDARGDLHGADLLVRAFTQRIPQVLAAARTRLDTTKVDSPDGRRACLAQMHALLSGGQPAEVLRAQVGDTDEPHLRLAAHLLRGRALLALNRLTELREVAETLLQEGRTLRNCLHSVVGRVLSGLARLRHGSLQEAETDLRMALAATGGNEAGWPHAAALTGIALCRTWLGRGDTVSLMNTARYLAGVLESPEIDEIVSLAAAEILLIHGRLSEARDEALRVADQAEDHGRRASAVEALLIAGQAIPDPRLALRLTQLAGDSDHDLPHLHATYLTGLARRSGAALEEAARAYEKLQLPLLAAAASAHAQAHLRAGGLYARANTATRRLAELITSTGIVAPGTWPTATATPLTTREREVAARAARGQHSEQIAEQLHLSTRTVNNHLQHCYHKLGVNSRRELADALGSPYLPGTTSLGAIRPR